MAGAGYKLFNTGDVLTAAQVNTYLQEQVVMRFATTTARDTALSGVLAEGMISYIDADNSIYKYTGSAWENIASDQTPLTTKGDLFTYSTTDTRLAVGNNGETLVADSSTSTGLRWQANQAAGRNAAINGSMEIWQRGTSFSGAGIYSADRWYTGTANTTFSQETSVVPAGFRYAMKMTTSTTAVAPTIWQAVETANAIQFAGQVVTLSFYARSTDAVTALIRLDYSTGVDTGIGGSWTAIGAGTPATSSSGFTRVSQQFTVPSDAKSLRLIIGANGNLSNGGSFYISGIQLEWGSVATTFTRAGGTLAGELAACQRYYWRTTGQVYTPSGIGMTQTSTASTLYVNHPVPMRVSPSTLEYSNLEVSDLYDYAKAVSNLVIESGSSGTNTTRVTATHTSGATAYRPAFLRNANNSAGYIGFSAEL